LREFAAMQHAALIKALVQRVKKATVFGKFPA
jgi:hypothetical protein